MAPIVQYVPRARPRYWIGKNDAASDQVRSTARMIQLASIRMAMPPTRNSVSRERNMACLVFALTVHPASAKPLHPTYGMPFVGPVLAMNDVS